MKQELARLRSELAAAKETSNKATPVKKTNNLEEPATNTPEVDISEGLNEDDEWGEVIDVWLADVSLLNSDSQKNAAELPEKNHRHGGLPDKARAAVEVAQALDGGRLPGLLGRPDETQRTPSEEHASVVPDTDTVVWDARRVTVQPRPVEGQGHQVAVRGGCRGRKQ